MNSRRITLAVIILSSLYSGSCTSIDNDRLARVAVASLYYHAERNGIQCGDLFGLSFSFRRVVEDEDTLADVSESINLAKCGRPVIDYRFNDADLAVALEWRSGRRDTLCFSGNRMRVAGDWCELDTALLVAVASLLPPEHQKGIDRQLHYVPE